MDNIREGNKARKNIRPRKRKANSLISKAGVPKPNWLVGQTIAEFLTNVDHLKILLTSTGSIKENLIGFLAITEMAGEYLTNAKLGELEKKGLDIQNCRGHGYDNGAHMPDVKKPHTIAEELILPAAIEILETMFGDNFAKELQSIPLSNDTLSRRIDDIAEDVEQQLFGKLRDKSFSIQLDEATDSNKDAHFIAYVRFFGMVCQR
ncbi:SCAN domain-containing protein 3 [Trichonephila clavipes]|nr:SCAN domain-containing protein 3 [Trichonephila clavipes]